MKLISSSHTPSLLTLLIVVTGVMATAPSVLFAHAGEAHSESGVSVVDDNSGQVAGRGQGIPAPLPANIAKIGGPFSLTNHLGESVTDQTYAGKHMLVFFGYSNCQVMCSTSLKRIADALTLLQTADLAPLAKMVALVITVDPVNDTPARLRESLLSYHPALTGLTGTLEQLKPVYKAYGQNPSVLEMELNESPIVSHSSYFFLMDPEGKLQTFFPPILNPESMAGLIEKYLPI